MRILHLKSEIAQLPLSDLQSKINNLQSISGEGGIRTHGGHKDHSGFRDRPVRPLRHLSGTPGLYSMSRGQKTTVSHQQ